MKKTSMFLCGIALLGIMLASPHKTEAQAEYSKYYIEGYYQMHNGANGLEFTLTDIDTKGVTIKFKDGMNSLRGLVDERTESIVFQFDTITTTCPEGFDNMAFYKLQSNNKWQRDHETENPTAKRRADMVRVIVLVLDCSNSLESNFGNLQKTAIKAIKTLNNKTVPGTIHLGIIAFNTVANTQKQVYPITPLNDNSFREMKNWIKGLHTDNNTAMYYAMDMASAKVDEYLETLDLPDTMKFSGVTMLTFTDGIDNHSLLENTVYRKGLDNPYHKKIREDIVNRSVSYKHKSGQVETAKLESRLFFVPGSDVIEDKQLQKDIFDSLDTEHKAFMLKNFQELDQAFDKMAENICDRFLVLRCFVPRAHEGRVRWTLDRPHGFFGVSVGGFGEINGMMDYGVGGGGGIDFGFPTKDFAAIGGFINIRGGMSLVENHGAPFHISFGMLRAGNGFQYKSTSLLGIGLDIKGANGAGEHGYGLYRTYKVNNTTLEEVEYLQGTGIGIDLRYGIISKSHFYYYLNLAAGYLPMTQVKRQYTRATMGYGSYEYNPTTGSERFYGSGQQYWRYSSKNEIGFSNFYVELSLNIGFKF